MNRVAEFEKVSYEEFYNAMKARLPDTFTDDDIAGFYENVELPTRATKGSMGYDFKSPVDFTLPPNAVLEIPTGIRVKIDEGWGLWCLPRSGQGFKFGLRLLNTVGVIDEDYYSSDNEGHIIIKLQNGPIDTLDVKTGKAFVKGVFLQYGITYSDDVATQRNGGFGSTDYTEN